MTVPRRGPEIAGLNPTVIVHSAPGASCDGQLLFSLKSKPEVVMSRRVTAELLLFFSVADRVTLSLPVACSPKSSLSGVNVNAVVAATAAGNLAAVCGAPDSAQITVQTACTILDLT